MNSPTRRARAFAVVAGLAVGVAACGDSSGPENVPDVSGLWSGQYAVTACMRSGALVAVFCEDIFAIGQSLILELELIQTGAELEGVIDQGLLPGAVAGDVDQDGVVVLSGTIGDDTLDATTTIISWQTELVGDSLIGSWRFTTTDNTGAGFGTATVDASLRLFGPSVLKFFGCPTRGNLELGGSVSDRLTGGDCELLDESFFDVWALPVDAGDSVSILLRSTSFDAFLLLADEDEGLINADDDNGGGPDTTDALIIQRFDSAGTLLVIANSFAGGETGPYTLTATRLGPVVSIAPDRGAAVTLPKLPLEEVKRTKLGRTTAPGRPELSRQLLTPRRP